MTGCKVFMLGSFFHLNSADKSFRRCWFPKCGQREHSYNSGSMWLLRSFKSDIGSNVCIILADVTPTVSISMSFIGNFVHNFLVGLMRSRFLRFFKPRALHLAWHECLIMRSWLLLKILMYFCVFTEICRYMYFRYFRIFIFVMIGIPDPGSRKWNKPINPESRGGRKNIPVKDGYKQGNGICQLFLGS